jgi:hypothetical protein
LAGTAEQAAATRRAAEHAYVVVLAAAAGRIEEADAPTLSSLI